MKHARRWLAAASLAILASPASAQTEAFPSRSIVLNVAGAAGGPTDTIARIIAVPMSENLGQTVVVEAIGGSTVAPLRVSQQRPDGYSLLINNVGFAASPSMYRRLPYEVPGSFTPLGLVSEAAMTIVTRPDFPAEDFAGLLGRLRRDGEGINFGAAGLGSSSNLCAMLTQHAAGARATMVNFRGTAPAMSELMAGRLDIMCDQATSTTPYVNNRSIRAWAVSSPARVAALPDLPTTAEAGVPSIAMSTWHGIYGPANLPEPIQQRIAVAIRAAMADPRVRTRFEELVTSPASEEQATPAFHQRFLAEEMTRWRAIIVAAGVTPE
ncbi:tripartite tricarboxylate transporter substrate binding protein BugD [Rhodovarius crocodyli]|uniref:Tripartite tricarboxylate transporter substrate binding protein BugD n=1 Tax=Rhodovarius crocodyli TaxID=1979269 RepID=A0A437MEI1_9PROT|nr:tripartite tricarboxylate transporter substrate-binding protein [Rhodovarius crocodyli]RVT96015.1 tripartite tricarboxylate transporter substrate binding protein BugD [Rhodovarius crocodyli]